jgi:hypothetical protein
MLIFRGIYNEFSGLKFIDLSHNQPYIVPSVLCQSRFATGSVKNVGVIPRADKPAGRLIPRRLMPQRVEKDLRGIGLPV